MAQHEVAIFAALAVAVAACDPSSKAPVSVMALVAKQPGRYTPEKVELATISDIVALKGRVATLVGGARIVIDPADPALETNNGSLTDTQLEAAFTKAKGMAPHASYLEKDGVLWPADFHTWNMVTTYYNFETAYGYWKGLYDTLEDSHVPEDLEGSRVLYFPSYTETSKGAEPLNDGALFSPVIQAFVILPFKPVKTNQAVPVSINAGVIAHEFAHRVFNRKVYQGRATPEPLVRWLGIGSSPGINLLRSIDEGLADFHAYGTTCVSVEDCNPRFLEATFGPDKAAARDLSDPTKCLQPDWTGALASKSVEDFWRQGYDYFVGTALASALYQAGSSTGMMRELQLAVVSAYSDTGTNSGLAEKISANLDSPHNFNLLEVADAILAHIPDPNGRLAKATCSKFLGRLRLEDYCPSLPCTVDGKAVLTHCPLSSAADSSGCQ